MVGLGLISTTALAVITKSSLYLSCSIFPCTRNQRASDKLSVKLSSPSVRSAIIFSFIALTVLTIWSNWAISSSLRPHFEIIKVEVSSAIFNSKIWLTFPDSFPVNSRCAASKTRPSKITPKPSPAIKDMLVIGLCPLIFRPKKMPSESAVSTNSGFASLVFLLSRSSERCFLISEIWACSAV